MPDPTTADNLSRTLATPATENPLAVANGHTANEGQLDEFDYFTQTVKPGAYFPGLPEYIEHEGNNFAANILPDSGNTLTFGTHRKVSSGVAQDGKPQYLSVRHNELARAQGRIDEKYDARMMINDQTGALTLTLILRGTAPADLERADLLIDYFFQKFRGKESPYHCSLW
jgi:hypothetical protein